MNVATQKRVIETMFINKFKKSKLLVYLTLIPFVVILCKQRIFAEAKQKLYLSASLLLSPPVSIAPEAAHCQYPDIVCFQD